MELFFAKIVNGFQRVQPSLTGKKRRKTCGKVSRYLFPQISSIVYGAKHVFVVNFKQIWYI